MFFIATHMIGGGKHEAVQHTDRRVLLPFQSTPRRSETRSLTRLNEGTAGTHDAAPLVVNTHCDVLPQASTSIMSLLRSFIYPKPQPPKRQELCEVSYSEC